MYKILPWRFRAVFHLRAKSAYISVFKLQGSFLQQATPKDRKNGPRLAIGVAIYRMGNRSGAKKWRKKMENGPRPEMAKKWSLKWKNGPQNRILAIFGPFFPFQRPFFGHFRPGAVSIFILIFLGDFGLDRFPITQAIRGPKYPCNLNRDSKHAIGDS